MFSLILPATMAIHTINQFADRYVQQNYPSSTWIWCDCENATDPNAWASVYICTPDQQSANPPVFRPAISGSVNSLIRLGQREFNSGKVRCR